LLFLPATVPVRIDLFELTVIQHPPVKLVESLGLNSWNPTIASLNRSGERLACTYPCAIKPLCAVFPRLERIVRRAWKRLHVGVLCRPDAKWALALASELENDPFNEENWIVRPWFSITAAPSPVERIAFVFLSVVVEETLLI